MWNVYTFRGELVKQFDTEQEALDWIHAQPVYSEFYRDFVK